MHDLSASHVTGEHGRRKSDVEDVRLIIDVHILPIDVFLAQVSFYSETVTVL